jgi:outer membrane protein assembly factor BamB
MRSLRICWLLLLLCVLAGPMAGADWPQFHGPSGLGVSDDDKIPTEWDQKKNVKWKVEMPGKGMSSPIVVGKKVFVTCYSGEGNTVKRHLLCVDPDKGSVVWSKEVSGSADRSRGIGFHGSASQSPASDGERVYVFFGSSGVIAFDMEGKEVWKQSVGTDNLSQFGSASSPIIWKDLVIVAANSESSALYGFDRKTGKQVWKESARSLRSNYSTPSIFKNEKGEDELLVPVMGEIWGMNPTNGKLKWYITGTRVEPAAATTLVAGEGGIVYCVGGGGPRPGGRTAFKVGGKDDVTRTNVLWNKSGGSYVGSPVYFKGQLYWVDQRGTARCVDAKTGDEVERKRLEGARDVYASVVVVKDKLYAVSRHDGTFVLEASPKMKELAHNKLGDTSDFSGSPAVSDGKMFLRSDKYLYCIAAE